MRFQYTLRWDAQGRYRPKRVTVQIEGLRPEDAIPRSIGKKKVFYEHDLLLHLALRGPRGGMFIDVGAHIGNHSVYFGKFLADYVVCIEPSKELQPILKKNLDINAITNYMILPFGAGAHATSGKLISTDKDNSGMGRIALVNGETKDARDDELVEIRPLDSLADDFRLKLRKIQLRLIKIDVEGMQIDVLKGARALLLDQRPQLVVEVHTPDEEYELKAFLAEFGYMSVGRFCATPTFHFINPRLHKLRALPAGYKVARTLAKLQNLAKPRKWIKRKKKRERSTLDS